MTGFAFDENVASQLKRLFQTEELRKLRQKYFAMFDVQPGEHVLDVGCGTGANAIALGILDSRRTGRQEVSCSYSFQLTNLITDYLIWSEKMSASAVEEWIKDLFVPRMLPATSIFHLTGMLLCVAYPLKFPQTVTKNRALFNSQILGHTAKHYRLTLKMPGPDSTIRSLICHSNAGKVIPKTSTAVGKSIGSDSLSAAANDFYRKGNVQNKEHKRSDKKNKTQKQNSC